MEKRSISPYADFEEISTLQEPAVIFFDRRAGFLSQNSTKGFMEGILYSVARHNLKS